MKRTDTLSGRDLREMFAAATQWLEKSVAEIDALNVFPVPDGDTGTNMLLTMRSTLEEAYRAEDETTSAVSQAMAKGALMGARGNSGVILSQIWRGLAQSLADKESFNGKDLADALVQASGMAYRGLTNPVEGTILTVMKDAAQAALARASANPDNHNPVSVMEAAVDAANKSVANTPALLPVLREAGVVDAGGQGLYVLLDGALRYLKGEAEEMQYRKPVMVASSVPVAVRPIQMLTEEVPFGYCTEFVIKGQRLAPDKIRSRLNKKGQSVMVVGDESTVRVHIHTDDPGAIIRYATLLGTMHQVSIRNMDEQHQDFLQMQRGKMPKVDMAIIAIVSGDGMADVFRSLGAAIVPGGQTMNPSIKDLLHTVEAVPSDKVIILPNDKNVILTAEQVPSLTKKKIAVVPTKTMPEGISALLAFDYEANFKTNAESMTRAKAAVKTVSITRAIRSIQIGGLKIKKRQFIAFLNGDLVAVGDSPEDVLYEVLSRLPLDKAEVLTVYSGATARPGEAELITAGVQQKYPKLQVELIRGGQPNYNYIVSIE